MKTKDHSKALLAALKKLEQSDTRLKRLRARRTVRQLANAILKQYPLLDKEGKEKPERSFIMCPLCRIPLKNMFFFTQHVLKKHWSKFVMRPYCANFCPGCGDYCGSEIHHLIRHLTGVAKDPEALKAHLVAGATKLEFQ